MVHLQFQREIISDLMETNALLVLGKGLGLAAITHRLVQAHLPSKSTAVTDATPELLLVIGGDKSQRSGLVKYISERIPDDLEPPQLVTADLPAAKREGLYHHGGVLFVSGRIVIVDLLSGTLNSSLITSVVILNAHRVTESSTEAFIMRVIRKTNSSCNAKALSDSAESFLGGWGKVEKVMRCLHLSKLLLWPRFHARVSEALELAQPEVIEFHQPLSPAMTAIQKALLEVIEACVEEVKRSNKIDTTDLTVDKALFVSFDAAIRRQLDPIWHSVGPKTKQLVNDLWLLRRLLNYLVRYDCVAFDVLVQSIQASEGVMGHHSPWLFMDAADRMFKWTKARIFNKKRKKRTAAELEGTDAASESVQYDYDLVLDENTKWELLVDVLSEIVGSTEQPDAEDATILIVCRDERTSATVQGCLEKSARTFLLEQLLIYHGTEGRANRQMFEAQSKISKETYPGQEVETEHVGRPRNQTSRGKTRGRGKGRRGHNAKTNTDRMRSGHVAQENSTIARLANAELIKRAAPREAVLHRLQSAGYNLKFHVIGTDMSVLDTVKPKHLVLYDPEVAFVREVEIFQALHPGRKLLVYFLMYTDSVEQRKYLASLNMENEAFEGLIRSKRTMAASLQDMESTAEQSTTNLSASTRAGGGSRNDVPAQVQEVIADIREFRSSLPHMLHKADIVVTPLTLEIGDYILSPDICVERKSIPDLFSSFSSGRLYQQAEAMTRHYSIPILLIEFDENRAFSFQSENAISSQISPTNIISKLVVLSLQFPRLRILWSRAPHLTCRLFQMLKSNRRNPDPEEAVSKGADVVVEDSVSFDVTPMDCLGRVPGVTPYNRSLLATKANSLVELASMSKEELISLVGPGNGGRIYRFFHT